MTSPSGVNPVQHWGGAVCPTAGSLYRRHPRRSRSLTGQNYGSPGRVNVASGIRRSRVGLRPNVESIVGATRGGATEAGSAVPIGIGPERVVLNSTVQITWSGSVTPGGKVNVSTVAIPLSHLPGLVTLSVMSLGLNHWRSGVLGQCTGSAEGR